MDNKLIESLSPIEKRVISHIEKESLNEIAKASGLDDVSTLRALKLLEKKGIVNLNYSERKIIDLGVNGIYYKKKALPERELLNILKKNEEIAIEEAKKISKLSENEFVIALGVLKNRALIKIEKGKIILNAKKEEIIKKSLEEKFIESLPLGYDLLTPEQKFCFENLKSRKKILEIKTKREIKAKITEIGKKIKDLNLDELNLIEEITPQIISNWEKNQKFRRYDIHSNVPHINGGKRHFVNQAIDYGKRIWLEMGFKEMTGKKTVTSFWNFDALYTAQDHPVREMHDTFFIKEIEGVLPKKEIVEEVKKAHQEGVGGSSGWKYLWNEKTAQKVLLRTHTTCLSSQTLAKLKKEEIPAKYFAIGRCFRNETIDWKHLFEFNQTEGIVIDRNANMRHLLGYLTEFAKKMGFNKIKFQPSFFPYTEPSVEGLVWNEEKKEWMEVLAAGIFRPEVTIPLIGENIPVLAWGPGFDRLIMMAYEIKDMREMYQNDLKKLRNMSIWRK